MFKHHAAVHSPTLVKFGVWRRLLPWIRRTYPSSWLRLATDVLPYAPLRHMRDISDSVCMAARQVLHRKLELLKHGGDALAHEIGEGKDLMSVLRECRIARLRDFSY